MNKKEKIEELKRLWMNGYFVCSIIKAREILQIFPNEFSVLIILGNSLTALDRFDEAIQVIEKANQLAAQDQLYHALVTMAFTLYEKGSFKDSAKYYKKAFSHHDSRPADLVFYADSLIKNGEYTGAIQLLTQSIIGISKPKETVYYLLGVAYRAIENYGDALKYFQKAVSIDRAYSEAIEAVSDILNMKELGSRATHEK